MAESYLQHAEHYFRLIAAAHQAQQQAAYGYQRQAGEPVESDDDDGDDDFSSLPDRFASPAERVVTPPQPAPQPYLDRPLYNGGGERPAYEPRQDRGERYERQNQDRQGQDRQPQGHDRPYQDRQPQPERHETRPERYDNRQDRNGNGRGERPAYGERAAQDRSAQDRNGQDRSGQDRSGQDRNGQDRNGQDRPHQTRDFDNRGPRNGNRGPRDFRAETPREPRDQPPRQPDVEPVVNALPAFITTPVRIQSEPEPVAAVVTEAPPSAPEGAGEDPGFALRPRRRRRTKAEFSGSEGEAPHEAPTPDPVGD